MLSSSKYLQHRAILKSDDSYSAYLLARRPKLVTSSAARVSVNEKIYGKIERNIGAIDIAEEKIIFHNLSTQLFAVAAEKQGII